MTQYRLVRGMQDIYGENAEKYDIIITKALSIAKQWNFQTLHLPMLEYTNLFERNLGDESDVVAKEIYKFTDRGGDMLALRPEFTAGVCRFIIENGLYYGPFPRKYFSYGPAFRYDRPQKGRYRQFNQLNFEVFGNNDNYYNNYLTMCILFCDSIGIKDYTIEINHLGSDNVREEYTKALRNYLIKHKNDLSEDSQRRLEANVLRILDSKNIHDQEILKLCPSINEFYINNENKLLEDVKKNITELSKANCIINHKLVRGLDYYTGFLFEITTTTLGSQSTICGGGEYNKMIYQMTKKHNLNAFGFAMGIERLMLMIEEAKIKIIRPPLYCIIIVTNYNGNFIPFVDVDFKIPRFEIIYTNYLGDGIAQANKLGADFCIFKKDGQDWQKDMKTGEQIIITLSKL
jgi:histidyl-tRNA synthetase